jgi:succinyl-CoA synthetase beta subunit
MKIHEYQGKALLKEYGVPVPRGSLREHPKKLKRRLKNSGPMWSL